MDYSLVWEKTLNLLKNELTDVSYDTWIKPITPVNMYDDTFYLGIENVFTKRILESRYTDLIGNAVKQIISHNVTIIFMLPKELESIKQPFSSRSTEITTQTSQLNPKYTFNTFVIGENNRFAHAASLAVAESPAYAYNPLFIYGGVGLGKTHLMQAIGHFILDQNPQSKIIYASSETFTNELINSIRDDKNVEFRNRYRNIDVLLIDDIQFIAGKESTQEEFFHTFNALHEANKQIIISSDRTPKDIPTLEERLRSRFEWGLIADIQPPNFETRIAIMKKKAELENIQVTDDVLAFIADKIASNIRELEGALTRIVAFSKLTNSALTTEVAAIAIQDIISIKKKEITIEFIQETVASYYNLDIPSLKSKNRSRNLAHPRQIAMYLCRKFTDHSLPEIGRQFGGRDHTTVLHAQDKIKKEMTENYKTQKDITEIENQIKNI